MRNIKLTTKDTGVELTIKVENTEAANNARLTLFNIDGKELSVVTFNVKHKSFLLATWELLQVLHKEQRLSFEAAGICDAVENAFFAEANAKYFPSLAKAQAI